MTRRRVETSPSTSTPLADGIRFPSAPAQAAPPNRHALRTDMAAIVTTIFITEGMDKVYAKLEAGLRVGERRSEPGILAVALDDAEANLFLAQRLYVTASIERERWVLENTAISASMRDEAHRALQQEKAEGERSKQITDADVNAKVSQLFPDQWAAQELARLRIEKTEKSLGVMVDVWTSKCRSLQVLLGRAK